MTGRRLGPIQRDVVAYLERCGGSGYVGPTTRAPEFQGLDLDQVERALQALVRRGVVRRRGLRYYLEEL